MNVGNYNGDEMRGGWLGRRRGGPIPPLTHPNTRAGYRKNETDNMNVVRTIPYTRQMAIRARAKRTVEYLLQNEITIVEKSV
jgi:hypothetical protein